MKRFAFVMDPLEKLDLPWDTSLCLLRELARQGHQNFLFVSSALSLTSNQVIGKGQLVTPNGHYRLGAERHYALADFDCVLIRKDPPFDSNYLALTYLLEPLASQTLVINHPRGIRNANEKLFGLLFKRWSPPTLVSSDPEEILDFQGKMHSALVIKPLYEKGGAGVFLLGKKSCRKEKLLWKATSGGRSPIVAQKFIRVPSGEGDKRILLWKGKMLGAFARIPRRGEFRSNLSLGGRFARCEITEGERRLVHALGPPLAREGLPWVGIDVRSGFLLEVNVTSPAGLVELDLLYGGVTRRLAALLQRA